MNTETTIPETDQAQVAEAVLKISAGIVGLRKFGLREDDIITLIQSRSKVSKANIRLVLGALDNLRRLYVK